MKEALPNPFNITKAVDFSDQEINDYWVDIPSGEGFAAMTKPTSPMPMLILGGKGSGKTHLMRYFSYPLQNIRHRPDVIRGIQSDGYIGIYLRCGGLNAARFRDKGQSEEVWADVFAYYMELWFSQITLSTIMSAVGEAPEFHASEQDVVAEISGLIDLRERPTPTTLEAMNELLRELQQELDVAVNNSAITRALPVHIAVTRGALVFGIPRVIAANIDPLRDCVFLYLIDEFENLLESQQKYVNTLLRERQAPCTFKIGARLYGVRTYSTYSADEDNKEGSEFEILPLDRILRENDKYEEFAKRLIVRRLLQSQLVPLDPGGVEEMAKSVGEHFEESTKSRFLSSETAYIIDKYCGKERPYFRSLRQYLEQGTKANAAPSLARDADIDQILSLLRCPDFPLLEKANLLLFYKEWSSKRDLRKAAKTIAEECEIYLNDPASECRHKRVLHHFKADLMAQLLRETDQRQRYVGLTTFIEISSGLPRNLLIILKHIFAWATFKGETPFRGGPISIRSQQAGVQEASKWFYGDARMIGREGQLVLDSIDRLGTLFRGARFSEKPSECSCSTFSVDVSRSSEAARHILDLAEKWSLLIDVGGQRDRNSERVDRKYQLNRMLAPRWDLAIFRRGVLALNSDESNAIFDPRCTKKFGGLMETRVARMTAPFFGKQVRSTQIPEGYQQGDLFSENDHD